MKKILGLLLLACTFAHAGYETGSANQVLRVPSGGGRPQYGQVDISQTAATVNQLLMSRGGTNANLTAANGAIPYSTASAFALLAPGTLGQLFVSGGAGAPTWQTALTRAQGGSTAWTSFTMSITGSSSNPTKASSPDVDNAQWKAIGPDTMLIYYSYKQSNNTGAAAGSGTYQFVLPGGATINTSIFNLDGGSSGLQGIGGGQAYDGTTVYLTVCNVQATTSISCQVGDTVGNPIGSTKVPLSGANARFGFLVTVPISSWGSL